MHVTRLSVTPIKGLGLHHPESIEVDAGGAVGDRDFFCVDDQDRVVSITKIGGWVGLRAEYDPDTGRLAVRESVIDGGTGTDGRAWEDEVRLGAPVVADFFGLREVPGHIVEGPWAAALSERAGAALRLVRAAKPGDGSDLHPITLLGDASLSAFAAAAGLDALDPRRFRMLIAFTGAGPYEEETWAGRALRIGTAAFTVGGLVPRCAATTRDPDRGNPDLPVVKLLGKVRGVMECEIGPGVMLGVYGRVTHPGRVAVGDAVTLA